MKTTSSGQREREVRGGQEAGKRKQGVPLFFFFVVVKEEDRYRSGPEWSPYPISMY
jgi:hypothetical protein